MKPIAVLVLASASFFSFHSIVAQTFFKREPQQSLEGFLSATLPSEDESLSMPIGKIQVLKWGNPDAGDKIVYLYATPGENVKVNGKYAYHEDGPLLLMLMEHQQGENYLQLSSGTESNEILLGSYPLTVVIDSATTADLDSDGIKECIVELSGSMRCTVEFEDENPETGEMETHSTSATCSCYGFAILRQEQVEGKWLSSFSMEFVESEYDENSYSVYHTMDEFILSHQK